MSRFRSLLGFALLARVSSAAVWTPKKVDLTDLQAGQQRFLKALGEQASAAVDLPKPELTRFLRSCEEAAGAVSSGAVWMPEKVDLPDLQAGQQRFLTALGEQASPAVELPEPELTRFLRFCEEAAGAVSSGAVWMPEKADLTELRDSQQRFLTALGEQASPAIDLPRPKLTQFLRFCEEAAGAACCVEGDEFRERGKNEEALAAYQQVVSRWPGTIKSRMALERVFDCKMDMVKRENAITWFRDFSERLGESDRDYTLFVLAKAAYDGQNYSECEKTLREVMPRASEAWIDRVKFLVGLSQIRQGKVLIGAETLTAMIESHPGSRLVAKATFLAGWAYYFGGDSGRALVKLQSVVRDYPQSEVAGKALKLIEKIEK